VLLIALSREARDECGTKHQSRDFVPQPSEELEGVILGGPGRGVKHIWRYGKGVIEGQEDLLWGWEQP